MQSLMDPNLASQQAQTAEPCRQDGPLMHERTDSPLEVTADSAQDLPYAQPAATCLPADSEQSNGPRHKDAKVDDSQVRRYRTAFTKEQIGRLEKEFSRENYLSRPKRCELAADLNLPESTIKVWFQNRRMKDKRQRMALAWPFGVPDPHIYAAYFASLSSYPYGLANHAQLGYPALGIPRTPTPLSPVGLPNPLQARPDLFHSLSSPLARAFPGLDSQQSPSLHSNLGCGLSLQSHYASQLLAQNLALCPGTSSGKPCTCHMFQDRLTGTAASGIGISSLLNSPTSHSISSIQNQS